MVAVCLCGLCVVCGVCGLCCVSGGVVCVWWCGVCLKVSCACLFFVRGWCVCGCFVIFRIDCDLQSRKINFTNSKTLVGRLFGVATDRHARYL